LQSPVSGAGDSEAGNFAALLSGNCAPQNHLKMDFLILLVAQALQYYFTKESPGEKNAATKSILGGEHSAI
jgi:hypothetical protein